MICCETGGRAEREASSSGVTATIGRGGRSATFATALAGASSLKMPSATLMDATPDRERAVGMPISADIVYVNKSPISPTRRGGGSRGLFVLTVLCLLGFGGFAFMAGRHTGRHAGKDMEVEHNAHEHNTMHTYFLLDRTGSMSSLKKAVEDGYESTSANSRRPRAQCT